MADVIGVRFRNTGKIYWFSPGEYGVKRGDAVIAQTSRGKEYGIVVVPPHESEDPRVLQALHEIVRPANQIDMEQEASNRDKEKDAFVICKRKIAERGLEMKLIMAEYTFDNSKILFYFTADGRVDFRELVRDLASEFKTRIELRQIGVRDESKLIGGYGTCGRVLCCHAWLPDFMPVSIKMAKEQNLSLNPTKISGTCGRLMCCLNHEEEVYEEINKRMPGVGDTATAPDGTEGTVISVNVLRETARIVVEAGDEREVRDYPASELEFVKSNHKRRKKPKIELTARSDQKTAREQAIKNAKEQGIQAVMERQQAERDEEAERAVHAAGERAAARGVKGQGNAPSSGRQGEGRERPAPAEGKDGGRRKGRGDKGKSRGPGADGNRNETRETGRGEHRNPNRGEKRPERRGDSAEERQGAGARNEARSETRGDNRSEAHGDNRGGSRGRNRGNRHRGGAPRDPQSQPQGRKQGQGVDKSAPS